jgi:hypothetical protein
MARIAQGVVTGQKPPQTHHGYHIIIRRRARGVVV